HRRNTQAASTCLWKTVAHRRSARVFPSFRTMAADSTWARRFRPAADANERRVPTEHPAPSIMAGYHSPVCSITGDAIDRIAAAIDQLASDAQDAKAGSGEGELTTRIAALWEMVSDLDPELARRARRYTGPVDGGPSA